MGYKIQVHDKQNKWLKFKCPACGYKFHGNCDLDFDEEERVPKCPECGEFIEDGDDEWDGMKDENDDEYCPG